MAASNCFQVREDNMTLKNHINFVLLLTLINLCFISTGLTKEPEMIYLEADKVKYDYKKGIVHYEGTVQGRQGPSELAADEMNVYYNSQHQIEKIEAIGRLARYKTLCQGDRATLVASARFIYYYPIAKKVELKEEAQVQYNKSIFSGPSIFYDIKNQTISSHPNKNNRARIILEPIKNLVNIKKR